MKKKTLYLFIDESGNFDFTANAFEIYFHQAKSDINCQMADYIGWAIAIKWERNEERSYALVRQKIRSEYEVFKKGTTMYY